MICDQITSTRKKKLKILLRDAVMVRPIANQWLHYTRCLRHDIAAVSMGEMGRLPLQPKVYGASFVPHIT